MYIVFVSYSKATNLLPLLWDTLYFYIWWVWFSLLFLISIWGANVCFFIILERKKVVWLTNPLPYVLYNSVSVDENHCIYNKHSRRSYFIIKVAVALHCPYFNFALYLYFLYVIFLFQLLQHYYLQVFLAFVFTWIAWFKLLYRDSVSKLVIALSDGNAAAHFFIWVISG